MRKAVTQVPHGRGSAAVDARAVADAPQLGKQFAGLFRPGGSAHADTKAVVCCFVLADVLINGAMVALIICRQDREEGKNVIIVTPNAQDYGVMGFAHGLLR